MTRQLFTRSVAMAALMAAPVMLAAQAKDNTSYGTSSAEFLLISPTARGMALGGSYTAMSTELGGLNSNPGALALLKRPGVQFGQTNYVVDTHLSWGGIATPSGGGSSAIGFQIGTYGYKDQPLRTPQQPDDGNAFYSVSETFMAATLAKNFSDRFSVGITAKGVFDQLGEVSGSAYAVDFGTHFHSQFGGRPTRFGFTITNLGTGLTYSGQPLKKNLPRSQQADTLPGDGTLPTLPIAVEYRTSAFALPVKFAVALAHDLISTQNTRLTLAGEFNQMRSDKAGYGGAAEFATERVGGTPFGVAVRGSYTATPSLKFETIDYTSTVKEKNAGLAAGFGVTYATRGGFNVGLDYGWRSLGQLGDVNTFSVTIGW